MGYVIHRVRAEVFVAREDQNHALQAIQAPGTPQGAMGRPTLAWIDPVRLASAATIHEALAAWRWIVLEEDRDGNIIELDFVGEKLGDEETLFEALAPYVRSGSQIWVVGEDGAVWRWLFSEGTVRRQEGKIVFSE